MKKDITEKLNFEENPKLVIKGAEIEVDTDATTVLKVMGTIGNESDLTPKDVVKVYETIFKEKDRKKIDKLELKMGDFQVLINEAISLIMGEEEQGE